ncbi:MAG: hypothetical protein JNM09_27860 [Blastocatellia bacterium]|nr:hypothetical protein [Blastocatellia bacterium]
MPLNYRNLTLLLLLLLSAMATGQTRREDKAQPPSEKKLQIEVKEVPLLAISITGDDIPLPAITTALAQKLRVAVTVSPQLKEQRVTLDTIGYSLEQTLRLLAPQPVVDYIVSGDAAVSPKYLAIHLQNFNEVPPEPKRSADAGLSGAEGSFDLNEERENPREKSERETRDASLHVHQAGGLLSVRARHQPLLVVLTELAEKLKVICEIQGSADEMLEVDFSDYSLSSAVRALSPRLQFYLRTNLQTNETTLWRIVLTSKTEP